MWSKKLKPFFFSKRRYLIAMLFFWIFVFSVSYITALNSEDYKIAKEFVFRNHRITESVGNVRQVKFYFWNGSESTGGHAGRARYSFDVDADLGKFVIEVQLINIANTWKVNTATIEAKDNEKMRELTFDVALN